MSHLAFAVYNSWNIKGTETVSPHKKLVKIKNTEGVLCV
jgi:hypothetical protein